MTQPLVSIVLPTHNGERYLGEAIESCLAQTYGHFEVIVVNDASTDRTEQIIKRYAVKDARVRAVHLVQNSKLPAALNAGMAHTNGEFVTWTSDDNCYEPSALAVMVRALSEAPENAMVYCDMALIDGEGHRIGLRAAGAPEALAHDNIVGACFLYRRDVAVAIGDYATDMFLVEDYDYWLRIWRRYAIAHIDAPAQYRYRIHGASLSARRKAEVRERTIEVQCRHLASAGSQRSYRAEKYFELAWGLRQSGDLASALKYAFMSVRLWPWNGTHWRCLGGTAGLLLTGMQRK